MAYTKSMDGKMRETLHIEVRVTKEQKELLRQLAEYTYHDRNGYRRLLEEPIDAFLELSMYDRLEEAKELESWKKEQEEQGLENDKL